MRAYLAHTKAIPPNDRVPWYRYLGPCYGALFLWLGYFEGLSANTVNRAPLGLLLFGFIIAGLLSYFLFFRIPAIMGMQTGYPVGVLGSSTFGSRGGEIVPGVVVAIVQVVMLGGASYLAARTVLTLIGAEAGGSSPILLLVGVVWAVVAAAIGSLGIGVVSRIALVLGGLPAIVLVLGIRNSWQGLSMHGLELPEPYSAMMLEIHLVTGLFSAIAVTSPGIGRYCSSKKDLQSAGIAAIILPSIIAGTLAVFTVAGARALVPGISSFGYLETSVAVAGGLRMLIPLILLAGALPVSAYFAWSAADSFGVMYPKLPRPVVTGIVGAGGALFAITGLAANLQTFITVLAAICAPICGIMAADYWQHDKRWPHTRPGVNYAGFGALAIGAIVGLLPLVPMPEHFRAVANPAAVFSWVAGFMGYIVLGNVGLKPYRKHRRKRVRSSKWDDDGEERSTSKTTAGSSHRSHRESAAEEETDPEE